MKAKMLNYSAKANGTHDSADSLWRDPASDGRFCDLCSGQRFQLLHAWDVGTNWNQSKIPIAVWKCECRLVFLHPVPTPEQLPGEGDWWSPKREHIRHGRRLKNIHIKVGRAVFKSPRQRLLKYTQKLVPSGRLLEVGCGSGKLLALASQYYDCVGVEPSPIAASRARSVGIAVIESSFEDARIEPQAFDVVIMNSSIEHVDSPMMILSKANRILRHGGVIAVRTPKFGGPTYRLRGATWRGFRHGYHTFLFSGETLTRYLEKTGFEVCRRPKRDRMFDDILILWARKVYEVKTEKRLSGLASSAAQKQ